VPQGRGEEEGAETDQAEGLVLQLAGNVELLEGLAPACEAELTKPLELLSSTHIEEKGPQEAEAERGNEGLDVGR
jgi:hypothetical protein